MKKTGKKNVIDLTAGSQDNIVVMNMQTYKSLLTELGEDTDIKSAGIKTRTQCAEIFDCPKKLSQISYGTHYGIRFPISD